MISIYVFIILISSSNAFMRPMMALEPFNRWHCIDFVKNIDKTKPYSYNIGDLPLVSWFDKDHAHTTMNICDHMGSKLDNGKIDNGCLYCPYHGIEHGANNTFGKTVIHEDKLWWSYEPVKQKPPYVPFYNNQNYETSSITVDVDAGLEDCILNTMDIHHPAHIHNNIFGFGSDIPPKNMKYFEYENQDKYGLSFEYSSQSGLVHLKKSLKKSLNFHMYEYPLTSWSRVSLPSKEHLYVNVNMLPLSRDKTRWIVTLKHNFWKSQLEKEFLKYTAKCIIYQDQQQMKRQAKYNILKTIVMNQRELENEDHMKKLRDMIKKYKYPSTGDVVMLYNYHKTVQRD